MTPSLQFLADLIDPYIVARLSNGRFTLKLETDLPSYHGSLGKSEEIFGEFAETFERALD